MAAHERALATAPPGLVAALNGSAHLAHSVPSTADTHPPLLGHGRGDAALEH